jgi:hypothetical protein
MRTGATRASIVALLLTTLSAVTVAAMPPAAAAASRAVVVVDFGDGVAHVSGITFTGTINGLDALQKAGYAPVVRGFAGNGGAVCALTDSHGAQYGCPADATCLTCHAPDYWSYFRAAPGATHYSYSPVGAGSTTVVDGEVEAWKWSPGDAPRFVPFTTVFPLPSTTTTARLTPPPPTAVDATTAPPTVSAQTVAPRNTSSSTTARSAPTTAGRTTTTRATAAPTTIVLGTTAPRGRSRGAASGRAPKLAGGGSGAPLGPFLAFLGFVVLLLAAIAWARVSRRRADA